MPVNAPMILDFDICQASTCKSFSVTDKTGVYSSSNSGGYGAPNFAIADAIDATLNVTLPNNTGTLITVFPTLPDSTGNVIQTITNTMLGLSGSLPDGIYVIQYTVNFNNTNNQTIIKTVTKVFLLSCTIKCCIDKMIAKIPTEDCDCNSIAMKNAILAFSLYQSLLFNGKCGNIVNVTSLLFRLTKLCEITNCGCS